MNLGEVIDKSIAGLIEKMTGVIMDGYASTMDKAGFEEAKVEVVAFLHAHLNKLVAWAEQNPGKRPPIYFLEHGRVVWLSRKQVRQMNMKKAKNRKLASHERE